MMRGETASLVKQLKEVFQEINRFLFKNVITSVKQDVATIKTTKYLDLEKKACDMHLMAKVGKLAMGELVRTQKGVIIVNLFLEGQELLLKQKDQVKYLLSSFNYCDEFTNFLLNQPGTPVKALNLDKNKTWLTSIYKLQKRNLFMKKLLSEHFLNKSI